MTDEQMARALELVEQLGRMPTPLNDPGALERPVAVIPEAVALSRTLCAEAEIGSEARAASATLILDTLSLEDALAWVIALWRICDAARDVLANVVTVEAAGNAPLPRLH